MDKYEVKIDSKNNSVCVMCLKTKKGCCFSYIKESNGPLSTDDRIGISIGKSIALIKQHYKK